MVLPTSRSGHGAHRRWLWRLCVFHRHLCRAVNGAQAPALSPSVSTQTHGAMIKSWPLHSRRVALGLPNVVHARGLAWNACGDGVSNGYFAMRRFSMPACISLCPGMEGAEVFRPTSTTIMRWDGPALTYPGSQEWLWMTTYIGGSENVHRLRRRWRFMAALRGVHLSFAIIAAL